MNRKAFSSRAFRFARSSANGRLSGLPCGLILLRPAHAGWLALDERRLRPLPADHRGVLELADAGGPQRPQGAARDPSSRVPRFGSTHTRTRCARGRPSLSKRQTSRCEISGLREPTLQAYRVIRAARPPTAAEPCPALRRWSNAAISCLSLAGSGGT